MKVETPTIETTEARTTTVEATELTRHEQAIVERFLDELADDAWGAADDPSYDEGVAWA